MISRVSYLLSRVLAHSIPLDPATSDHTRAGTRLTS
jgi:hypothetical protein